MKHRDEEIAKALLWLSPGVKFWFRESAAGPITEAVVVSVHVSKDDRFVQAKLYYAFGDYKFRLHILSCRPMWEEP